MFGLKDRKKEDNKMFSVLPKTKDKSTILYEYLIKCEPHTRDFSRE